MKLKHRAIALLTKYVPRETLRAIYRGYIGAVHAIKYGDSTFPRIITIEINSHCNRACTYCPNVVAPQSSRLIDPKVFEAIARRIGEINYTGVVDFIFFSEPTLHKKLADCIAIVKKYAPNCITRISTNGDFLSTESVASYRAAGLDRVYVMRHVPTPDGWVARINSLAAEFPGLFTIMDIEQLERTIGLNNYGGVVDIQKVLDGGTNKDGSPSCKVHEHIAQITIDGDWNLCCTDFAKSYSFGNLVASDIMTIWRNRRFMQMRTELRSGVAKLQVCRDCFIFSNNSKWAGEHGLKTYNSTITAGGEINTVSRSKAMGGAGTKQ